MIGNREEKPPKTGRKRSQLPAAPRTAVAKSSQSDRVASLGAQQLTQLFNGATRKCKYYHNYRTCPADHD